MNIKVRKATINDVEDILRIASAKSLKRLNKDSLKDGFLVSDFSKKDYIHFLKYADFCFVAEKADEVVGFSVSYLSTNDKIEDSIKDVLKDYQKGTYIIGKQMASLNGSNAALNLIKVMIDLADFRPIINAIVLEPFNEKSVALHEKLGCKKIVEFTPKDGLLRGVWRKEFI